MFLAPSSHHAALFPCAVSELRSIIWWSNIQTSVQCCHHCPSFMLWESYLLMTNMLPCYQPVSSPRPQVPSHLSSHNILSHPHMALILLMKIIKHSLVWGLANQGPEVIFLAQRHVWNPGWVGTSYHFMENSEPPTKSSLEEKPQRLGDRPTWRLSSSFTSSFWGNRSLASIYSRLGGPSSPCWKQTHEYQ